MSTYQRNSEKDNMKKIKQILCSNIVVISLALYPKVSLGKEQMHYGVFFQKDRDKLYGTPLIDNKTDFQKNIQNAKQEDRETLIKKYLDLVKTETSHFKANKPYQAFSANGSSVKITILNKNEPEGGEFDMLFESKPLKSQNLPVLFWSSKNLKPTIIQTQEVHLDKSKIKLFEDKIRTLVSEASSGMRDPYSLSKILKPSILSLKDEGSIVTLFFPLIVTKKDANNKPYEDERGSVFFLYDSKQDKVIIGKFGHPEWSPEAKNVNVIKPVFFFNMNNTQYCFCQYDDAWEHNGFALIELRSGKVSMVSY